MPKTIADKLAKSLSIEVEELLQEDALQIRNGANVIPLNLKVKVKQKDSGNSMVRRKMITIPRNKELDNISQRIHQACSDQTIISFNVLLDADFEKKKPQPKTKRNLFGLCLGIESEDEDSQYIPSDSKKTDSSKSDTNILKNKAPDKYFKNVQQASTVVKKHNSFFGKCKPGGCLDPPFGEEKYAYKLTSTPSKHLLEPKVNHLSALEEITVQIKEPSNEKVVQDQSSSIMCKKNLEPSKEIPVQSLYQGMTKTMLDDNASDSIITYPTTLSSSSSLEEEKNEKNLKTSKTKQSNFSECNRLYFSPPKTSIASNVEPVIDNAAKYRILNNKRNTGFEDEPTLNLELTTSKDELSRQSKTILETPQCLNDEMMTIEPSSIPQNSLFAQNVSEKYLICDTQLNRNADSDNGYSSNLTVKHSIPKTSGFNENPKNESINERTPTKEIFYQFDKKAPQPSSQEFCANIQTEQNKHNLRDEEPHLESNKQSRNEVIRLATLIIDVICQQQTFESSITTEQQIAANNAILKEKIIESEYKKDETEFPTTDINSTLLPSSQLRIPEVSKSNVLMIPIIVPPPLCQQTFKHGSTVRVTDQTYKKDVSSADTKSTRPQLVHHVSNELNYRTNEPMTLLNKSSNEQINQAKEQTPSRQISAELSRQGSISYNKKDNIDKKYINQQFSRQESTNKIPSLQNLTYHELLENDNKLASSKENSEKSLLKRLSIRLSNKSKDKHSRKSLQHRTSLTQPISNSIIKNPSQECQEWDLMSKESVTIKKSISKELNNQDDVQNEDNIVARKPQLNSVELQNKVFNESLHHTSLEISKQIENKKSNHDTDLFTASLNKKSGSFIDYMDKKNNYDTQLSSYTSKQNDVLNKSISQFDREIEYDIKILPETNDNGHVSQDISFAITISDITDANLKSENNPQTFDKITDKNKIRKNIITNDKNDRFINQIVDDDEVQKNTEINIIKNERSILNDSFYFTDPENDSSRIEKASYNKQMEKKLSNDVISFDIKSNRSNSEILTFSIEYGEAIDENVYFDSSSRSDNDNPTKLLDYTTIPITQPNEYKSNTITTLAELDYKNLDLDSERDTKSEKAMLLENSPTQRDSVTTPTSKIADLNKPNLGIAQLPSQSLNNSSKLRVSLTTYTSKTTDSEEAKNLSAAQVPSYNSTIQRVSLTTPAGKITGTAESEDLCTAQKSSQQLENSFTRRISLTIPTSNITDSATAKNLSAGQVPQRTLENSSTRRVSLTMSTFKATDSAEARTSNTALVPSQSFENNTTERVSLTTPAIKITGTAESEDLRTAQNSSISLENNSSLRVSLTASISNITDSAKTKNLSAGQMPPRSIENSSTQRVPLTASTIKATDSAEAKTLNTAQVSSKSLENSTTHTLTTPANKITGTAESEDLCTEQNFSQSLENNSTRVSLIAPTSKITDLAEAANLSKAQMPPRSVENNITRRVSLATRESKITDLTAAKNVSTAQEPSQSLENSSRRRISLTTPISKITDKAKSKKNNVEVVINAQNKPIDDNKERKVTTFSDKRTIAKKSTEHVFDIKSGNVDKQKRIDYHNNTLLIEKSKPGSIAKSSLTPENRVERASIFVDLSFQAKVEESQIFIKSLDSRSDQHNKTTFTSTITSEDEIKLPVLENYTMSISVNSPAKNKYDSYSRRPKHLNISECKSDVTIRSTGETQSSTAISNSIQIRMSSVYDKVLLPLHQAIQHLKEDVDELSTRQIALREAIGPRKLKISRTTHNLNYKACHCMKF